MNKPRFNIGDEVWIATWTFTEKWITCPDCCGQKYLTVILGDQSQVTIDCETCRHGYELNTGVVKIYDRLAVAERATVTGIEWRDHKGGFEYRTTKNIVDEDRVWSANYHAMEAAKTLVREENEHELKRIKTKEKPSHTWAWHVTYHRRQIKEAKKNLDYHVAKLDVAKQHTKEEEKS